MDIKKKYRLVFVGFVIMLILNIGIIVILWMRPFHGPAHPGIQRQHRMQQVLNRRLGLSQQQQQAYHELQKDYRAEIKATVQQIRENRSILYDAFETADSAQVDSFTTLIAEGQKKLESANMHHFMKVRALLNKEQKQKFDKMLDRIASRPSGRRHRDGKIH